MNKNIYLAGEGWGNDCAREGLYKHFKNVTCIKSIEQLIRLKDEIIVFAGYKPLVPHDVIVNNDCLNIHYSLLPKYRGLHATVWAIINDEDYVGLTIHKMSDFIDDGPIIHQYQVENDRVKTSTEYMELFNAYIADNLGIIISDYLEGRLSLKENDKTQATWVGKRDNDDCRVDFEKNLHYLKCFFRALVAPYPLPYVVYKGEKMSITKVDFHAVNVETHIGRILNIDDEGLWVKAKDGYVIIKELTDKNNEIVPFGRFRLGQYFNR